VAKLDGREVPPQVRQVGRARIEAVMREALRAPTARVREWTWQPLPYHAVLPDRTLVRVTGWARLSDDRPIRWSSVLKLFGPAPLAAGAGGRREVLAYRSSLLAALPGPLRARGCSASTRTAMAASGCGWKRWAMCMGAAGRWPSSAGRRANGQLETVAVDWEQVGPGPIGADAATLVFGTLRRCEFDAERAPELDRVVFDGYVDGLRDAGWTGPVDHVRLGFAAAVALRWGFLAGALRELLAGAPQVQHRSHGGRLSTAAAISQWVRLIEFVPDRAQEPRRLSAT
jgi:hypothetical protein